MDPEPLHPYPRQVWFVLAMVLILGALAASIAFGFAPGSAKEADQNPSTTATSDKTEMPPTSQTSHATATSTRTPSPTLTDTPQITPSITPSPTSSPTPTHTPNPSPSPTSTPADHYWLERPIVPEGDDRVARFYDYASRADGTYPIHRGVEFVNDSGTPALAVASGSVIVAGDDSTRVYGARTDFYGKLVILELDRRYDGEPVYVLYGHLSQVDVEVDQHVETGERIGQVGMTGVAEGPHIHLEVRYGENDYDRTVNPELWLIPKEGEGTLAGQILSPAGEPLPEVKLVLYRAEQPGNAVREMTTYPDKEVNPDPLWNENFATGDVEAGEWLVELYHKGELYTKRVSVEAGATTWVSIRTRE
ncbi:MAG: M23 family metallopeptidase [Chloroflexota bacterium]